MATKYIINNEDGLITTGQTINGGISATTISADTLIISGSPIPQPSYKVYTALLTQTGTSDPTSVVLENTLGGDIVWSRVTDGQYLGTLNGAFPDINKVFITPSPTSVLSPINTVEIFWNDSNSISVVTVQRSSYNGAGLFQDDILNGYLIPLEIRVYD